MVASAIHRRSSSAELAGIAVARALVAVLLVALVRALLFAVRDGYFSEGLWRLGARGFAGDILHSALGLVPAVPIAWVAGHSRARATRWLIALASLGGGYWLASRGLPPLVLVKGTSDRLLAMHAVVFAAAAAGTAVLVVRPAPLRRRGTLSLVGLCLLALAASAVARLARGSPGNSPNLILISLDTVRADHLGCYGHARDTSPALDRFAERCVRFTRAYTPQPWTLTAHMTMLTGLYPSVHGLARDRGLPEGIRPLPSLLHEAGYATYAVVDRVEWLLPRYGYARGFQLYRRMPDDAGRKVDRILDLLDDHGEAPFFLFAHFYDAHSDWKILPYDADPEDLEALSGWYAGSFTGCGPDGECASDYLAELSDEGPPLAGEDLAYVESLYDAGIRSLDRQLARLFADLESRGLLGNTVVLVTSDHGEEFFEHGRAMHVHQGYEECLRVPLLILRPDGLSGTSDALVSLVDVTPTLLDFAGLPPSGQGTSLRPFPPGPSTTPRDHLLFDGRWNLTGLRSEQHALVDLGGGEYELYDLWEDPAEAHDLSSTPEGAAVLGGLLRVREEWRRELEGLRADAGGEVELSEQEQRRLRSLGY